jgi:hypothetical protein
MKKSWLISLKTARSWKQGNLAYLSDISKQKLRRRSKHWRSLLRKTIGCLTAFAELMDKLMMDLTA